MNSLFNIHTHHPSPNAVVNVFPADFQPEEGLLYSVGIHPWHAAEADARDWELLEQAARHPQVVMIGECGLDKRCRADWTAQQTVFERQIALSEAVRKPLLIHCVKAFNEVLTLKRHLRPAQPWVVHGFRGKPTIAYSLLEAGCYLSFGPHFHEESLQMTPVERLFIETDEADVTIEEVARSVAEVKKLPHLICDLQKLSYFCGLNNQTDNKNKT
jgi:TatD DNase family protein